MKVRRVLAGLLSVLGLVALIGLVASPSAKIAGHGLTQIAQVQEAEAASYTVRYKNSVNSTQALTICKDWGDTVCSSSSPRGYLSAGQWSHIKYPTWYDVDGFYV